MKFNPNPPRQEGLSLIELMVAITLGLMITMTLGYIMMGSRGTYRTQDASARTQDTGRFALEFIGRQLRAAGRVDITPLTSDGRVGLPNGTDAISGLNGAVASETIEAINVGGAVVINNGTRQTDTLTVVYQLTDMGGETIADCNGDGNGITKVVIPGSNPARNYGLVTNVIALNGGTRELRCTGNGGGGAQPFAEGVEDFQVVYGVDTTGDKNVDSWNASPGNWDQVVAVQVCLMVQSPANGVVTAPQRITDCSGNAYTPGDTRLRRTFTSVFTLRNRVNRLPI